MKKQIIFAFFFFLLISNSFGQAWKFNFNINGEDRKDLSQIVIWDFVLSMHNNRTSPLLLSWVFEEDRRNYTNAYNAILQMLYENMQVPELSRDSNNIFLNHITEMLLIINHLKERILIERITPPQIVLPETFYYSITQIHSIAFGFNDTYYPDLTELALWDYSYQMLVKRYFSNYSSENPSFLILCHEDDIYNYTIIYNLVYRIIDSNNENLRELKEKLEDCVRRRVIILLQ